MLYSDLKSYEFTLLRQLSTEMFYPVQRMLSLTVLPSFDKANRTAYIEKKNEVDDW